MILIGLPAIAVADCPDKQAPRVLVEMTTNKIKYDFSLSKAELKTFNIDTESPYDQGAHTEVGGLMNGEISVNTNVKFGWASQKRGGDTCYWFDEIRVAMHIDPLIYIANEHEKGSCMHKSIMDHEMKHVDVDRKILKGYSKLMEKDLRKVTKKVGVVGPVSKSSVDATRQKMMAIIEKTVSNRAERMYADRRRHQQKVDTLQEYERIANSCP